MITPETATTKALPRQGRSATCSGKSGNIKEDSVSEGIKIILSLGLFDYKFALYKLCLAMSHPLGQWLKNS
jgi:hypothetical protein